MKELKLGVISDLEGNQTKLKKIISRFKKEKIEALVLAGEIPSHKKNSLKNCLNICLKLKIPVLIIPGSHESFKDYSIPLSKIKNKLIINGLTKSKINIKGYDFVFVPGSDVMTKGSQYHLVNSKKQTKKIIRWRRDNLEFFKNTRCNISYLSEIKRYVKDRNTILISHIPPKFNNLNAIDVAEFFKKKKIFSIKGKHKKNKIIAKALKAGLETIITTGDGIILTETGNVLKKLGYPVHKNKKNVGNKPLMSLIKSKKVTKLICGHIHEAGNKACNLKGDLVKQNKLSRELFLNNGQAEEGYASIINLIDNLAKYKIIKI